MAWADLAAEVATEVALLPRVEAELAGHAAAATSAYRLSRPGPARTPACPGWPRSAAPAVTAIVGRAGPVPHRPTVPQSFTGLAPRAQRDRETDRKGQPMSKAGYRLLRTTLIRAADNARNHDPQLARIYYVQMVERGAEHLKALLRGRRAPGRTTPGRCSQRGMPYVICDTDGTPVDPATRPNRSSPNTGPCPREVRARRRSRKRTGSRAGKAPQQVLAGHDRSDTRRRRQTRRPSPRRILLATT